MNRVVCGQGDSGPGERTDHSLQEPGLQHQGPGPHSQPLPPPRCPKKEILPGLKLGQGGELFLFLVILLSCQMCHRPGKLPSATRSPRNGGRQGLPSPPGSPSACSRSGSHAGLTHLPSF